jgi:hypothetical protein
LASAQDANAIQTLMLRKTQDITQQQSQEMIQSVAQPANLPNQGQVIDVKA